MELGGDELKKKKKEPKKEGGGPGKSTSGNGPLKIGERWGGGKGKASK